jgi:hypothetical protein
VEKYWKAEDGRIEERSAELWDSWPVQRALEELPNDPEAVFATLAGRMFLAGECCEKTRQPSQSISPPTSEPPAGIDALAQAIYSFPQGAPAETISLSDQLDAVRCQPEISKETSSVITQLVLALLRIKRERMVSELRQNTDALMDQTPQSSIDGVVEYIVRGSQEEGGAS